MINLITWLIWLDNILNNEERRKILNTDDKTIKNVKNIGELPYWYKSFHSNEGLNSLYKDFFSYFTDQDWELEIVTHSFFLQILVYKKFKDTIDAEELFNEVQKSSSSINKAIELEGYQSHYQITFNNKHQSENNPKTHKNDIYKYKGFDKISEPRFSGDTGVGNLYVKITFTII